MPVPTLWDLSKAKLIQYIDCLDDVGDYPYELLRDVLIKIKSPDQLAKLETNSPQICGFTWRSWKKFIERDIPAWLHPQPEPDPESEKENQALWTRKLYRKLMKHTEHERKAQEEVLKANLKKIQDARQEKTAILDSTKGHYTGGGGRRWGGASGIRRQGSSTYVPKTGKPQLDKLRKSLATTAAIPKPKAAPVGFRNRPASEMGTVKAAPAHMIRAHRRAREEPEVHYPGTDDHPTASIARRKLSPSGSGTDAAKEIKKKPAPRITTEVKRAVPTPDSHHSTPPINKKYAPPPPLMPSALPPRPKRKRTEANPLMAPKRPRKA